MVSMLAKSMAWARYNATDAAVTRRIWEELHDDIDYFNCRDIYEFTLQLIPVLLYMQSRGVKVNTEAISHTKIQVMREINEKKKELHDVVGYELNPASPKQCCDHFYEKKGLRPYIGKTGNPTTDDKALKRLARLGHEEASIIQEIRHLEKLLGTYLEIELDPDGRLRSQYNPRGTKFGRLSSSQTIFKTGANMQNIHPQFRSFVIPDEGHIIVEMDKKQSEWVITAYASGDERMIDIIETGKDPHIETAKGITGLPEWAVKKESKIVGKASDRVAIETLRKNHFPEIFEMASFLPAVFAARQGGKKCNHGLNYRMGASRFALENEMEEADARPLVTKYRRTYPGLIRWWDEIEAQIRKDRVLTNCYNRRYRFLGSIDYDLLMAATSYIPQSTNGDMVNDALIKAHNDDDIYVRQYDPLTQTHDSITFQLPLSWGWGAIAKCIMRIKQHMEPTLNYRGRDFVVGTDLKIGLNWGDFDKSKNPFGLREVELCDDWADLANELYTNYLAFPV